jgi:hypothetical protein
MPSHKANGMGVVLEQFCSSVLLPLKITSKDGGTGSAPLLPFRRRRTMRQKSKLLK